MAIVTTNDKHYGDIADAIRTMADIETTFLPSEMAAGILAIPSGGGDIDALIDRSITTISSNVETIGADAFYGCESLVSASFPLATTILSGAFAYASNLVSANIPLADNIPSRGFYNCRALTVANFPLATALWSEAFYYCNNITTTDFSSVITIWDNALNRCSKITKLDFPLATSIGAGAFQTCTALNTLILRSSVLCTLQQSSALQGTKISGTNPTGYIYVPSTLVASYQAASNWTTFASRIRAIEDYPEITGG